VQPGSSEPAQTAGNSFQVVRIIRMHLTTWDKVPNGEQERILGRRKLSGAPMHATSPDTRTSSTPCTPTSRRACSPR
jgi:deferrochelatase/peroxidase EfeB